MFSEKLKLRQKQLKKMLFIIFDDDPEFGGADIYLLESVEEAKTRLLERAEGCVGKLALYEATKKPDGRIVPGKLIKEVI